MSLPADLQQQIQAFYDRVRGAIPGARRRFGQRQMIAAIAKGLYQPSAEDPGKGQHLVVVEGKTGVGKTVGYLVPAITMARAQKKKLILSTATVSLQEQLFLRDLPTVSGQAGYALTYGLAKGRSRYVCPLRLNRMSGSEGGQDLFGEASWSKKPTRADRDTLGGLAEALEGGKWDGSKDTYPEAIEDALWAGVSTDSSGCTKKRCAHFKSCPYYKARAQLQGVDVIVANHDLVLSVLSSESTLLPSPSESIYVIDEAHHLPECAIDRFTESVSVFGATRWLDKVPYVVAKILALLPSPPTDGHAAQKAEELCGTLEQLGASLRRTMTEAGKSCIRYPHGVLDDAMQAEANAICSIAQALQQSIEAIQAAIQSLQETEPAKAAALDPVLPDFQFYASRIWHLAAVWSSFGGQGQEGQEPMAKWISVEDGQRTQDFKLHVAPVTAARVLSDHIWSAAAGVVLTSATITSLGNFDYFLRQSGLAAFPATQCHSVDSPFDYAAQGTLVIPKMRVDPGNQEGHTAEISTLIPEELRHVTSGCLALFSSKKRMQAVFDSLPAELKPLVLMQGTLPRVELIRKHQERVEGGSASILFGLASMGEGLDLPGALCETLLIDKIPFPPPDSPLEEAIAEWVSSCGGNPFDAISLPKAGLKLVQWVGRLIRSETDTGRIVIFDRRLVTKTYGRRLLAGLPEFTVHSL